MAVWRGYGLCGDLALTAYPGFSRDDNRALQW